jgi:hypothetical protein
MIFPTNLKMKKVYFLFFSLSVALSGFAQSIDKTTHTLLLAQKMTSELAKIYNLSSAQTGELEKIQEAKYEALVRLEFLKTKDLKKYIAKRISTFETADNSLMVLLDATQMAVFKKQQIEKSNRYDEIVGGMKKQGIPISEIEKKMAETEF